MNTFEWFVDFIRDPRFTLPQAPFAIAFLTTVIWGIARYQPTRRHVNRFAARQRLVVTTENGGLIGRALAIGLRWRRFGLACGVVVSVATGLILPHGPTVHYSYATIFLGWFAGALAGEWRIASRPVDVGARRYAGLATRSLTTYLTWSTRVLLGTVLVFLTTVASYGVFVEPILAAEGVRWSFLIGLAVMAVLLAATFRRITQRPQPFVEDAERQADDALRSHSLTVLAGCAIAAAGWQASLILNATHLGIEGFPFVVPGAVLGWWVAARSRSVRAQSVEGRLVVGEVTGS